MIAAVRSYRATMAAAAPARLGRLGVRGSAALSPPTSYPAGHNRRLAFSTLGVVPSARMYPGSTSLATSPARIYPPALLTSIRFASTAQGNGSGKVDQAPLPSSASKGVRWLYKSRLLRWLFFGSFSILFGIFSATAIILAHDSFTYGHRNLDKIQPSKLALHPEPGGPKNLPVVSEYVEGEEDDFSRQCKSKERLVIVGGGWAAVALLSKLDPGKYDVTLVSPNNFYLFTPLLPSATVGTVEPRSLIEPIRKILARHRGHYVQGKAIDVELGSSIDPADGGSQRLLEVQLVSGEEKSGMPGRSHPEAQPGTGNGYPARDEVKDRKVYIPYDKLVVAVGSVTSTHGVPGLENAFHLKDLEDARGIRSRILDNLEIASLPTTTPEERKKLLSFVISGGGPTGVETASEIYDMLNEDVLDYYPKLLRQQAQVWLIQSRSHILNTYSEKISKYAEDKFARDEVKIVTNARVKEVKPDSVAYTVKDEDGNVTEHEVPSGMTLWSTGIAMSPFTRAMTQMLPNQSHLKALLVDSHLRVQGTPKGTVYALGDASTVDTRLIDSLYDFVDDCDADHDGRISYVEFQQLAARVRKRFPLASKHFEKLKDLFDAYDKDHDEFLSVNEIADMFLATQRKMTSLPATAQVASQEGAYLAKKLNKLAKVREEDKFQGRPRGADAVAAAGQAIGPPVDVDDTHYRPFNYRNLGSLAYIGNAAAFDLPLPEPIGSFAGGLIAMYMWRSFYLSEQVSTRTRVLLLSDYIRRGIWGRDISRL